MVSIVSAHPRLIHEINEARLLTMATSRMAKADPSSFVPADQLYAELGITPEELDEIDQADMELSME